MPIERQSILVVGGGGLLGTAICNQLKHENIPFLATLKPNTNRPNVLGEDLENFIEVDLESKFDLRNILRSRVRSIIYVAQSNGHNQFPAYAGSISSVNFAAAMSLLEQATDTNVDSFVYASTGGIYKPSSDPLKEDSVTQEFSNMNLYLKTKLYAEQSINDFSKYINISIARYFFIYGANQKSEMLIPRIISNIKKKIPITLPKNRGFYFNPIFDVDAARATIQLIKRNAVGVYNIAGSEVISLRELCLMLSGEIGIAPSFENSEQIPTDLIADITKIKSLDYYPKYSLMEGLQNVLKFS